MAEEGEWLSGEEGEESSYKEMWALPSFTSGTHGCVGLGAGYPSLWSSGMRWGSQEATYINQTFAGGPPSHARHSATCWGLKALTKYCGGSNWGTRVDMLSPVCLTSISPLLMTAPPHCSGATPLLLLPHGWCSSRKRGHLTQEWPLMGSLES